MKVLKWILIIIGVIIAIFLIYSASQPNKMEVSKSITIDASSSRVFAQITDFSTWDQWATWNQKDSAMKTEITGEPGTVGAKSQWWSTHPEVGNGSQEIVEVTPNEYIKTEMRFDGWEKASYAAFKFTEEDGATTVVWSFEGAETPFYFNFMNSLMAPVIGMNYEQSLEGLKTLIESQPAEVANPMGLEITEVEAVDIVSIKDSTTADGIGDKLTELFTELTIYLESTEGVSSDGMPLAMYYEYSAEKVVLEAAIPYTGEVSENGRIMVKQTPSGKAIKGIHYGDYNASGMMHEAIETYMKESKLEFRDACIEIYANDPTTVDSAAIETHIIYPVQ